jgi:hypothetical protein
MKAVPTKILIESWDDDHLLDYLADVDWAIRQVAPAAMFNEESKEQMHRLNSIQTICMNEIKNRNLKLF